MIKAALQSFIETLIIGLYLPQLLLFWNTTEQALIMADVEVWINILGWPKRSLIRHLLLLLFRAPEFRNLYYYRVSQGNLVARIGMNLLRVLYPQFPTLFIDRSCTIGPGLFIQHGFSTIIMADLGDHCWINQQVTIGYKDKSGRPKIGNNVRITAGAKVLGNITLGNNVIVGANAVVVKDIPDNCVVVGIPARIIKQDGKRIGSE